MEEVAVSDLEHTSCRWFHYEISGLIWQPKATPGSAGGEKKAYGEGRSRQEKVSELE